MEIKDYQPGDEKEILHLFNLVFGRPMSPDHWNWRFLENPAGQKMIKLMWDNGILVGHYAVSPIEVKSNGNTVLTSHSLATMTHPDYGGKGVFKKLSSELYHYLEEELGSQAIWGFPNTNSHYGFVNYLKWEDIGVIHTLALDTSKISDVDSTKYDLVSLVNFDERDVQFIEDCLSKSLVHVKKSVDYLNWRYISKPNNNYRTYRVADGNKTIGIAVTKLYKSSLDSSYTEMNILELHLSQNVDLKSVLSLLLQNESVKINRMSVWKNIHDPNHLTYERAGFAPSLPLVYLAARPNRNLSNSFLKMKNWSYSMGDSDVF